MDQAMSILPRFTPGDAALWLAWFLGVAWLPGEALRRAAGLDAPQRCERWALTAILGILWASWTYYLLASFGGQRWHLAMAVLPGVAMVGWWLRSGASDLRPVTEGSTGKMPVAPVVLDARGRHAEIVGVVLVAAFVVFHVARIRASIVPDEAGVRLYGALYSDKLTNMSPCAALIEGVPPANLRMSGHGFPYHYFPHLLVAAASRATGVDYRGGFWFYAAALGIAINGLAVLGFARHVLGSYGLGLVGLVYFGLTQFGPEARPLDLSIAMLLLGLVALDRCRLERRRRWGLLAVLLWSSMPLYEAFHAQAMLGGLAVWWVAGAAAAVRHRVERRSTGREPRASCPCSAPSLARRQWHPSSGELYFRTLVAGATLLGAVLTTQTLTRGAKIVSSAKVVFKSSYRESYRDEWLNAVRDAGDRPNWARSVLRWKRGRDPGPDGERDLPRELRPNVLERMAGEVFYDAGFVVYVVLRFLNVGVLGLVALGVAWRGRPGEWRSTEAIIACVAVVGFALPALVTWGHMAEGRWWETPNLYRFPHCAYLLLVLLGSAALMRGLAEWRRARWWLPLGLAVWQLYALLGAAVQSPTSFHHVSRERLAALEFLRREVPGGQIVIHPWIDDLIRDSWAPERVAWVYKRHFTLGSNLAGVQMFYEGREDHLFIGGFIAPEEVLQRRRLRQKFYASPDAATLHTVIDQGGVQWVVADREHAAPAEVERGWSLAFERDGVRIYRRTRRF